MRILVIEPDPSTARFLENTLRKANFNVYHTDMGDEGLDLAKLYDYDLITIEPVLPDMSGFEVLRKLRLAKIETPVLILSGLIDVGSKIKAFGFGADDYLTKPFDREELIARAHAIIRRARGHAQSIVDIGPLRVNLDACSVKVNGQSVILTEKEYQMLSLLALRKNWVITKEMFLNYLYGGMDEPELKVIDVFICKLRRKLAHAGMPNCIETVWGKGYRMSDPA